MFTVHELDRAGDPGTELLSTKYLDIAEDAIRGLVQHRFPEQSQTTQKMVEPGTAVFVICQDGIPYRRFTLRSEEFRRWRFEEVK